MNEEELHAKLFPEANKRPEYIICAAMHYDDGKIYKHQPKNITSGYVIAGRRHHNCIALQAQIATLVINSNVAEKGEGFLTSKDRFVNRKEAAQIAHSAGQCAPTDCLFSEDLY